MGGLGGADKTGFLENIMEWLIGSVLILIATTSTIAGLAIMAVIFLVLAQASILLYRSFGKPQERVLPQAQGSARQS